MDTVPTLETYFYDQVEPSHLDGDVKAYLVMRLAHWATHEPTNDTTLGLEYMEALQSHHWHLRAVGDRALYWAGVTPHTMGPLVSRNYVENVGISAFAKLAEAINSALFSMLSEDFRSATDVLYEVSRHQEDSVENLLQRTLKDGDDRDEEALRRRGVLLLKRRKS